MAWLALVASIGLQSVMTALLGLSMTPADGLLMLALTAAACALLGAVAGRGDSRSPERYAPTARRLVWLNVWTAVSCLAFFLGVAVHSAGLVFTLEALFAPLGVTAWMRFRARRGDEQPLSGAAQWWAACVLAMLGALLVVRSAPSESGNKLAFVVAAMLGVIAGCAAGGVIIVSRDLARSDVGVVQVMAHRFYATGLLAVITLLTLVPCGLLAAPALPVGLIGVAALASVVAPLFLLQYAIHRLTPVSIAAGLATMPAIAMAVELTFGRAVSWIVLLLGMLAVPVNLALLATQQRNNLALLRLSGSKKARGPECRTSTAVSTVGNTARRID